MITQIPDCAYWLVYELADTSLSNKGFSLGETQNARYDANNPSPRSMFDYSLKFTTSDVAMVGDYTVLVNVLIKDNAFPPYSTVSPPLQLTVPVAVRNCGIAASGSCSGSPNRTQIGRN